MLLKTSACLQTCKLMCSVSWLYYHEPAREFSRPTLITDLSCSVDPRYVFTHQAVTTWNQIKSVKLSQGFYFLFFTMKIPKYKWDFTPKLAPMCIIDLIHIPQSIDVKWLHSSMAAFEMMIVIKKSTLSDPRLMHAIYKVTPVLLDIITALYSPTEWLTLSSLYCVYCWLWSSAVRVWVCHEKLVRI